MDTYIIEIICNGMKMSELKGIIERIIASSAIYELMEYEASWKDETHDVAILNLEIDENSFDSFIEAFGNELNESGYGSYYDTICQ